MNDDLEAVDGLDIEILRLKAALDNVPAHVYIKSLDSTYTYANRATMALFGCRDESELVGHSDDSFFPAQTANALRAIDRQVFRGETSEQEVVTTDSNGNPKVYWEVKTPLYAGASEPRVIGLLGISSDITQIRLLADENQALKDDLATDNNKEIVGADFGLASTLSLATKAGRHDSSVLLLGETGVGKDVIANYIHRVSTRSTGPFISVNCGAIPEALMDSELFGHEKGAFTGAVETKRGKFERANGGTIFLDEIGELPMQVQVRLLRVLQNREIERVGGSKTLKINVRVLAATHRDIASMVADGSFREDLFFRLNVMPITVPPLRERKQDIPAFLDYFTKRKSRLLKLGEPPRITPELVERLSAYRWPGNIRELENVIERALITSEGPVLNVPPLLGDHESEVARRPTASVESDAPMPTLEEAMVSHIKKALRRSGGKIHGDGGAASLLDINPNTLRSRMRKYGIPFSGSKEQQTCNE